MSCPTAAHLVIRASAGSGKTYQLTRRYLALLAAGMPPSEAWAATFTRKAAGEILERIVSALTEAASSEERAATLADTINCSGLTPARFVRMLRDVLSDLHRLRIGTLDSLFLRLAGAFPLELGLPPGWGIVDEADAAACREDALDAVLTGDVERLEQLTRLYERLAPGEAKRAVRDDLLQRVKTLYGAYLAVPRAGWQTEPPKAPKVSVDAIIKSARSVALPSHKSFVKECAKDLDKASSEQWMVFIAGGLAARILSGADTYFNKLIPEELIACYKKLLDFAAFAVNRDLAMETAAAWDFLDEFHQRLAVIRQAGGGLRFDDVARALADRLQLDAAGFDYRIDGRIGHLLLDEFQDTSTLQWRVLEPLARQVMAVGGSVFAVGDVKQAIYGWRGGRAELLDKLPADLGGVPIEEMDHSRRASRAVIDCVNRVFENLAGWVETQPVKAAAESWQKRFNHHTTERAERIGFVHVETGPAALDGDGAGARRARHYEWVAKWIKQLVNDKRSATVGILCRKNQAVGRIIYHLRKDGIAASEEGGNPITDSPAVEGILSLLTLADHPGDKIAAFHLATEPFAAVLRASGNDPAKPGETAGRVRAALIADGYGPVVADWAERLKAICPASDCLRLDQLVELADAYQTRATLRPAAFVAHARQHKAATPTGSRVRVLTLHTAKGLEYDAVVLPELDVWLSDRHYPAFIVADPDPPQLPDGFVGRRVSSKLGPLANEMAKEQTEAAARRAVEESLSLLYVALTRAREALYAFPPGPTGKRTDCWDTLLLGALCPAQADAQARPAETVVYTTGDAHWEPEEPATAQPSGAAVGAIRFRVPDPGQRRAEWVAPSQQEGSRRVSAARLFAAADSAGLRTGTLHHAWLEAIEWLDEGEPTDDQLRSVARRLPYEGTDLTQQIALFRKALRQPAVRKVLSRATYPGLVRMERERPFAVRVGDQLVGGRIDRLVWLRDGVLVIDYKTDAIPAAAVQERVEFYRPQMEAYLRAVAALRNLASDRVSAALVFTALGQVEWLRLPGR
jgi:ATP-dependent exoDNAse (exonuclease V) beta subunit